MLNGLFDLVRGRRVVPAAPVHFVPNLPEVDADDDQSDVGNAPDLASVAGIGCIVTYGDSKGNVSIRRVTCRKLSHKADVTYLQAFCHERSALRTLRVDRMVEVACGVTGEVFTPGATFFRGYSVASEGGAAVGFGLHVRLAADLKAGLNVLSFLAKVDGKVVPEEQEVIKQYCASFGLRYGTDAFDHEGACRYALRLAPDAETFYVAMERLTRGDAPPGIANLTGRFAGDLIEADGVQHPEEFYYGLRIREYLAA